MSNETDASAAVGSLGVAYAAESADADREAERSSTDPLLTNPVVRGQDPRTGRFVPGNSIARKHGLYVQALASELAAEREAFLAQSVTDDGGISEVPTRRRSLHIYRARLHVHIEQLSDAIERMGIFDGRGRLRGAWLQRLEGLIARAQAIDATLGLARRTKRVQTLADWAEQNGEEQTT